MIHGLVDRALTFTMEDLKRLPSVTRLHFIECAGNRHNGRQKTVQESHGMTSCAEWTGVLLSTLLKERGLKGSATWFVAEGAEEVKGASSMPIAKAMDDCIIAYVMNGEDVPCAASRIGTEGFASESNEPFRTNAREDVVTHSTALKAIGLTFVFTLGTGAANSAQNDICPVRRPAPPERR
jgi:hypothetical protein